MELLLRDLRDVRTSIDVITAWVEQVAKNGAGA